MKIGIEARVLEKKMTGVGRYLLGLLQKIPQIDKKNQYFIFSYKKLKHLEKENITTIGTIKKNLKNPKLFSFFWFNFFLPRFLKRYKIDLFFVPNPYLPILKTVKKEIFVIYDFAHKVNKNYKSFFYRKIYLEFLLERALRRANFIITISENTKKDLLFYYPWVSFKKVKVILGAAEEKFRPRNFSEAQKTYLLKKYNLPQNFILFLGKIEPRKNIQTIIKVADLLKEKNLNFVLIGEKGEKINFSKIKKEIKKRKNIFYLKEIEEKDLPYIYNLASIFFFPSFYEGFGLPVLEAMASGVPVVSSNSSSLKEVVAEGGLLFSPYDFDGFLKAIVRLSEDRKFYQIMKKKAIWQAKKFSWEKSAQELVNIFNNL